VYQVGKETKYLKMMHGQPSIKISVCLEFIMIFIDTYLSQPH